MLDRGEPSECEQIHKGNELQLLRVSSRVLFRHRSLFATQCRLGIALTAPLVVGPASAASLLNVPSDIRPAETPPFGRPAL